MDKGQGNNIIIKFFKILGRQPTDMDITVNAFTMENLANIIEKMFTIIQKNQSKILNINNKNDDISSSEFGENNNDDSNIFLKDYSQKGEINLQNSSLHHTYNSSSILGNNLNNSSAPETLLDPVMFRRPYKIKDYGKITFTIYGMDIDMEVLAKNRTVLPVPGFVPTGEVREDAILRDLTINAVFYNIRNKKIIDPLNGILDMEEGVVKLPQGKATFMSDFLRLFSIIKTTSKLSFKISDSISKLIQDHIVQIKQFTISDREEVNNVKLRRIILGDYSLRAFKLLYDFNLFDSCIPENYYQKFNTAKILCDY